jgi:hypothetical protein
MGNKLRALFDFDAFCLGCAIYQRALIETGFVPLGASPQQVTRILTAHLSGDYGDMVQGIPPATITCGASSSPLLTRKGA